LARGLIEARDHARRLVPLRNISSRFIRMKQPKSLKKDS
jgi:hypothetical protein